MNPNTGELALLRDDEDRAGFDRLVDRRLAALARMKIEREPEAPSVNLRSKHPLAEWAKRKRKAKIAAASRRRNRR